MSPTVVRSKGYRLFFFSREEERLHIHVSCGDGEAKFWLLPEIELAQNYKLNRRQLREIEGIIAEHLKEIIDAWHEHFGG